MKKFVGLFFITELLSLSITAQLRPLHTVLVILENHSYSEVAGNPLLPYMNSLLADTHTAVFTNSYALSNPSQPNYLQLFSGSAQGVIDDLLPTNLPFTTPNIGSLLIQNKFSFSTYSEDLPSIGFAGISYGDYRRKHNPMVNWQGNSANGIPMTLNKPFTDFPVDFATNLPTFSIVVPNQVNDMHTDTMSVSFPKCDNWLKNNLDKYIQWCKKNNSLFILTFDEGSLNHILTFFIGENIKAGYYNQPITHYNVLRTIEDLYQLPYAGASKVSSFINNCWLSFPVCNGAGNSITSNLTGIIYQWQVNTGSSFVSITDNANYTGTNTSTLQLKNIPSSWNAHQFRSKVDVSYSNSFKLVINNYFTGAVSTAWENSLNWSCGILPDSNTNVIISGNQTVVLNSAVTVRSFTLSNGANFSASSNKNLTVLH